MTLEIAAVLLILVVALVLFVTEKLRMDVVALLVMSALGVSGLVGMKDALAGFSNPAVITVWSMFILSAGLSATGVADIIGRQVTRLAGNKEPRMIIAIMLTTGVLSAFMNNIGVAALMLPVVMDIARRAEVSPSRLLMPMAYASLLGGLTTLVGTPPNLVASDTLRQTVEGHDGFGFFTFTPIGLPALIVGTLFVAFIGRHLLPSEMPESFRESRKDASSRWQFSHDLEERQFRMKVADDSPLDGRPLKDSGLGAMLGMTVLDVEREGESPDQIDADFVLRAGDLLTVQGRREEYADFLRWQAFEMAQGAGIAELLSPRRLALVSVRVSADSKIVGLTVAEADFRHRFHSHIVSLKRNGDVKRADLADTRLSAGDHLYLELLKEELPGLQEAPDFESLELIPEERFGEIYPESETLMELSVPPDSRLAGISVAESGLGEALALRVVAMGRKPESIYFPEANEEILPGDRLLVHGTSESIGRLKGIQSLSLVDEKEGFRRRPADDASYTEATLSPRSSLAGKTLRELDLRRHLGLQVISIWRRGRAHRSHLRNFTLEFGDALLLAGPRKHIDALSENPDFVVLSQAAYEDQSARKTPKRAALASFIMAAVVVSVLVGWLPIAIAAVAGGTLMVVTRCLKIEEAHRAIEWKSVFLIACMIPLGTAMKDTGAAEWMAHGVAAAAGPFGPWGLIVGLYLLTSLATTIVPTAALVLIMAQIGIDAGKDFGLSPELTVMAIAMAASASFTSPISHPANVLVMGPGGYRFIDYIRMGLLLALVVMATVIPMIAWIY